MRRNGCGMSAGGPQGRQPQAHCRIDRRRVASLVSCFLFFAGSGARSGRHTKEAFPIETWRRRGGPRSSGSTDSRTGAVCSDDHKAPGFRKATACPALSQGGNKASSKPAGEEKAHGQGGIWLARGTLPRASSRRTHYPRQPGTDKKRGGVRAAHGVRFGEESRNEAVNATCNGKLTACNGKFLARRQPEEYNRAEQTG